MLNGYFRTNTAPEVGMVATELFVTDRYVTTITAVAPSGKQVTTWDGKRLKGWVWDPASEELVWDESPAEVVWTLRKNGRWVTKGQPQNGTGLLIGVSAGYRDPSF